MFILPGARLQHRALLHRLPLLSPRARAAWPRRCAGALLASLLWEAAKQLFRWYILSFGVYDQIYGPLGALVALSMFAYYSAIVFILGAEYTAALLARGARRASWLARPAAVLR